MSYHSYNNSSTPSSTGQRSPSPKLEPTAASSSWGMENDLYPELYRPDGSVLAKTNHIAQLPIVRPLILRPDRTLTYLHNLSHGLRNYKSALVYQRGTLQSAPCSGCVGPDPWGPFKLCVVLSTAFQGSCTNCSYNGNGTRCSLRREDDASGRPVNPHSRNRESALRRELTVDRTPKQVIDLEGKDDQAADSLSRKSDMQKKPSASPDWYVRRHAAEKAESRLAKYTYGGTDVLADSMASETEVNPPRREIPSLDSPSDDSDEEQQLQARRPSPTRSRFTARRGGHRSSHGRTKSDTSVDTARRKRTSALGDSEDDVPLARRRKLPTPVSTSEQDGGEYEPVSAQNTHNVPDVTLTIDPAVLEPTLTYVVIQNLAFASITLPPKPTLAITNLSQMKPQRTVEWNKLCNRNLTPKYNIEAALGFCVGDVAPSPCARCSRGAGAFTKCVTVAGHFNGGCTSCRWNQMASECNLYVPNSTKGGLSLLPSIPNPNIATPGEKMTSEKRPLNITIPAPAPAPAPTPTSERNTPGTAKAASRSQRYQKALFEAEQLTLEEQQLELAELNFQRSVISNVIANNIPPSRTPRYKNTQTNFEEMSPEEQQLELAGLKFQISVMQDAIANRNEQS